MWRLKMAIWLLQQLLKSKRHELDMLRIDDDIEMALQPLERAATKV
jgi:hypothetical protein